VTVIVVKKRDHVSKELWPLMDIMSSPEVIQAKWSNSGMILVRKLKNSEENFSQFHTVSHKSYVDCTEPQPQQ
jgi:hypothetical protein